MKTLVILSCLAIVCFALPPSREQYVRGQFMLRLDEEVIKSELQERKIALKLRQVYNLALKNTHRIGKLKFFSLEGRNDVELDDISNLLGVKYIERNVIGYIDQCLEQPSPGTYGLDRIDQREKLTYSDPTSEEAMYTYGENQGENVVAYIVDSGVDIQHEQFEGRARWGFSAGSLPEEDDNGHGTHCAGTVGSRDYGVAKAVEIVAVKVINWFGGGELNFFVEGMEWVLSDHTARYEATGVMPKSVVSASLGYPLTQSIDDVTEELFDNGIAIAVSAGNDDGDACNQSPARTPAAFATGSTDVGDVTSDFSNYGPCVGVYAPGSNVLSTLPDGETAVYSGTSMAAPHVAGAMARYMSSLSEAPSPQSVQDHIRSTATVDAISWYREAHSVSDNLLLYSEC